MRQPMFALFLSAALAACAGEGGTNDPVDDGDDGTDDGDDGTDDGTEEPQRPAECPSGAMGAVASLSNTEAYNDPLEEAEDGPRVRYLWGTIDDSTEFEIDLYDGYGAFKSAPAAPGTFTIEGEDADPIDCGLCVYVNIVTTDWYYALQATGGTITLETVDGRLKGTASSLTFTELDDFGEGYMAEGACGATIDSISFDTEYIVPEDDPV